MKAFYFERMGYDFSFDEADPDPSKRGVTKRFHQSDAAVRIVTAPARGSKSYSAAPEVVAFAMPTEPLTGSLQWLVGVDYPTNKEFQYVWKYIVEQKHLWPGIKIEKAINNPSNGNMIISLNHGRDKKGNICRAVIEGKSSSNERSLQGEHVTNCVLSEAAEHPQVIFDKYLSTRCWKSIFPTTPKPHGEWIRNMADKGRENPDMGIESFEFSRYANPRYDHDQFARAKRLAEMNTESGNAEDDPFFAEQFLGRWVYYTGRVLPFDPLHHVVDVDMGWIAGCPSYVSVDYGYEDGCVALFWALHPSGALLIWDEIYERHMTTPDFVTAIVEKLDRSRMITSLKYVCGDPKQPQVAEYMQRNGLPVTPINKRFQADRALGQRRLIDLLQRDPDTKHAGMYVGRNCERTISEWKTLHYREKNQSEYGPSAFVGADHAFDAARYFVTTLPRVAEEEREEDWIEVHKRKVAARVEGKYTWENQLGLANWAHTGESPFQDIEGY
jgi:hypothetical protein